MQDIIDDRGSDLSSAEQEEEESEEGAIDHLSLPSQAVDATPFAAIESSDGNLRQPGKVLAKKSTMKSMNSLLGRTKQSKLQQQMTKE